MSNEYDGQKHICSPDDEKIANPFFAYGIFKPGQIAFSKIREFARKWEDHDIACELLMRDGVPLIENEESRHSTKGFKIYFNREDRKKAYDIISETEPFELYEWDVIDVGGDECNILVGKKPDVASHKSLDDNDKYVDEYDGRNDPYFDGLIEFIREEIKDAFYGEHSFHRLQMNYMLLWSAIDRYCSLKYGSYHSQKELRSKLASDDVFNDNLQKCWDEKKIRPKQIVYSTELRKYRLTRDPLYAINYYYTIRCNVVHRGKDGRTEEGILRQSLDELLDVFEGVINDTFSEL